MNDIIEDFILEEITYATSKRDAAAVLSASYHPDGYKAYELGFVGTAYTAAHEAMELLLKVYLRRGSKKGAWGHNLGELFMKWDERSRTRAEIVYQRGVLGELETNRIAEAAWIKVGVNWHRELPQDFSQREEEYREAFRQHQTELLCKNSSTVRDVVRKLDDILGAKNITSLCNPSHESMIRGYSWWPEVWYPEELLSMEWSRFSSATRQGKSLSFIETFLKREGAKEVFEGWRYLSEKRLEETDIIFHGPSAKMILIAQHLEHFVSDTLINHSSGNETTP